MNQPHGKCDGNENVVEYIKFEIIGTSVAMNNKIVHDIPSLLQYRMISYEARMNFMRIFIYNPKICISEVFKKKKTAENMKKSEMFQNSKDII